MKSLFQDLDHVQVQFKALCGDYNSERSVADRSRVREEGEFHGQIDRACRFGICC